MIERIENNNLWKKFVTELEYKNEKPPFSVLEEGGKANAMLLFHGTTSTDPSIIIDSHEGLDYRFNGKNATMLGKGVYFHKNASYSDGYAYKKGTHKIMIVAKVLVGQTTTVQSDSQRTVPPLLEGSDRARYDTINGGDGRYVVFTNAKSYPAYLITYN